jgi:hypothetical protein
MHIWSALWRINVLFRRKTGLQIFSKQRPTEVRPPYPRGAAISHENIQSPLRLFRISKVSGFQHLAIVPNHWLGSFRSQGHLTICFPVTGLIQIFPAPT